MHGPFAGKPVRPWPKAREALLSVDDPKLQSALDAVSDEIEIHWIESPFAAICNAVCHQQMGMTMGHEKYKALAALCEEEFPTPPKVAQLSLAEIAEIKGMTNAQAMCIRTLADEIQAGVRVMPTSFQDWTPEQLLKHFEDRPLKHLGKWSLQFVQLYGAQDGDALLAGDASFKRAMAWAYDLDRTDVALDKKIEEIAEKWRPYRAPAAIYIYRHWEESVKKPQEQARALAG